MTVHAKINNVREKKVYERIDLCRKCTSDISNKIKLL